MYRLYRRSRDPFWEDPKNQRDFLDNFGEKFKLKRHAQWLKFDYKTLQSNGGKNLLTAFDGDLQEMLSANYPFLHWEALHTSEKKSYFDTFERQRGFIDDWALKLEAQRYKDLEYFTKEKISELGGKPLANKIPGKSVQMLSHLFQEYNWDRFGLVFEDKPEKPEPSFSFGVPTNRTMSMFWSVNERQRRLMEEAAQRHNLYKMQDFWDMEIKSWETFFKEYSFDVLLPKYENIYLLVFRSAFPELPWIKKNSKKKKTNAYSDEEEKPPKYLGEEKIPEHLWKKVEKRKPFVDLSEYPTPIQHLLTGQEGEPVPGSSPLMNSSNQIKEIKTGISLAHVWDSSVDPTGYWISEKFDGYRAIWNGKILISRHGKEFSPPAFWLEYLPKTEWVLDGELFVGYNQSHIVTSILGSTNQVSGEYSWRDIKFMVFDFLPSKNDAHVLFEKRFEMLKENVKENDIIKIVQHYKCEGENHLIKELDYITEIGGEGLIIRKPHTCYTAGRSEAVLKVRKHLDCEVKYLGKSATGISLVCLLPNDLVRKIKCGMSDYNHPPEVGSILTVNHYGWLPNGGIKFPDFRRIRFDMSWEDVKQRYKDVIVTPPPGSFKKVDESEYDLEL